MAIIGLTGGIGSGKSAISRFFEAQAITCVDMDDVAREVVAPGTQALADIANYFKSDVPHILDAAGQLNRKALRETIFANPKAKHWLETLLHPLIRTETYAQLATQQEPYAILVSPLLIEKSLPVDAVIVVDVTEEEQLKRVLKRDNTDAATTQHIIKSQLPRHERLAHADYVIDNNGRLDDTQQCVIALHHQLLKDLNPEKLITSNS